MITIKKGNIFDSDAEVLVNPVNCVGVMGKGLALEFKKRYPLMFVQYQQWCKDKTIYPGNPCFWQESEYTGIICFPTKWHWKEESDLFCVTQGLDTLVHNCKTMEWRFQSIAFPALGCGLGGLKWDDVASIMVKKLLHLYADIEIYEPE